jgi:hypothetical protein
MQPTSAILTIHDSERHCAARLSDRNETAAANGGANFLAFAAPWWDVHAVPLERR